MADGSIPAVAYYRMSDPKQDTSIPAQREAVEKLARKHRYRIVRVYKDEGISGDDTERRAGFKQMLADATKLGDFQAVRTAAGGIPRRRMGLHAGGDLV